MLSIKILPIITPVEETRRLYLKKFLITECLLIITLVIANLFCKLDNPKRYLKFFQELSAIYAIIDYFKLDENTGI